MRIISEKVRAMSATGETIYGISKQALERWILHWQGFRGGAAKQNTPLDEKHLLPAGPCSGTHSSGGKLVSRRSSAMFAWHSRDREKRKLRQQSTNDLTGGLISQSTKPIGLSDDITLTETPAS